MRPQSDFCSLAYPARDQRPQPPTVQRSPGAAEWGGRPSPRSALESPVVPGPGAGNAISGKGWQPTESQGWPGLSGSPGARGAETWRPRRGRGSLKKWRGCSLNPKSKMHTTRLGSEHHHLTITEIIRLLSHFSRLGQHRPSLRQAQSPGSSGSELREAQALTGGIGRPAPRCL